jgi:hypothetical protein
MTEATIQSDAPASPRISIAKAAPPRMVLVYSNAWSGPRPGVIVSGPFGASPQRANVNVMLDGSTDADALAKLRARREGNTLAGVPIFDAQTDEERAAAVAEHAAHLPFGDAPTDDAPLGEAWFIAEFPARH